MKNLTQSLLIFLLITGSVFGQQEKGIIGANNWLANWTEFKPNQSRYDEPTQILAGNIEVDTRLVKRDTYLLLGNVFVTNGATVTIEPGTVIIGGYATKGSLTIVKGSNRIADGLETVSSIFTSNRSVKRAGDWGRLIIVGDAPTKRFGNGSVASFYTDLTPTPYAKT